MEELKMLTREDVAEILHAHVNTVSMLMQVGIIQSVKVGKNYMFPKSVISSFQTEYLELDCSNRQKAIESKNLVDQRKQQVN